MTELPGLPPLGPDPALPPYDDGYVTAARRARSRRRARGAATVSASVCAALVLTLTRLAGPGATGLAPVGPGGGSTPAQTPSTADPSRWPRRTVKVGTPPVAYPSVARPDEVGGPQRASTASPSAAARKPEPQWTLTRRVQTDQLTRPCDNTVTDGWCWRYLGHDPISHTKPTTFTAELCRRAGGRSANEVHFVVAPYQEIVIWLTRQDGPKETAESPTYPASTDRPHVVVVREGTCLRWTYAWNGIGNDGTALAPGTYRLLFAVQGWVPRRPLPGDPDKSTRTGFFHDAQVRVV
jgi:hypothetical protein